MEFETTLEGELNPLVRRLRPMVGSTALAEDLGQEALLRALESAPRSASPDHLRAWVHRVATNLAIDEMRRRSRRRHQVLEDTIAAASPPDADDAVAARSALERVSAHERLLLLLRFEGGLSHREIAFLLDISEPAARQRLARARRAFAAAFRRVPAGGAPRIYVLMGEDEPDPYLRWLREAGADARLLPRDDAERAIALADAVVVGGSRTDVHPRVYGEVRRAEVVDPDPVRDHQDMAVIRAALEQDVPIVGICRGHQLLNVALGGTLHQDLAADRVVAGHPERHTVHSSTGSFTRRVLGASAGVSSRHHQAVKRLGGGLRAVSISDDGVIEAVELPRSRFALGVQFHPEEEPTASDRRLASALVDAAARRAA